MDKQYATQGIGASLAGYAISPAACDANVAPETPVNQALNNLLSEISDCHYQAEGLIVGVAPVLRCECQETAANGARPSMSSELAERIQQMADSIRRIREKLSDARERLTL